MRVCVIDLELITLSAERGGFQKSLFGRFCMWDKYSRTRCEEMVVSAYRTRERECVCVKVSRGVAVVCMWLTAGTSRQNCWMGRLTEERGCVYPVVV